MQENPNTVIVESGNIVNDPKQLDVVPLIFTKMHYDAVGIGDSDLQMGDVYFKKAKEEHLPVLDATPKANESTKPFIIKNVDGVNVGIVSFERYDSGRQVSEFEFRKAQYSAYKQARDASDVLILLDHGNTVDRDWIERNGPRLGSPDIVVCDFQKQVLSEPEVVGKTYIVPTGFQGKALGVADVEFTRGQDLKVKVQKTVLEQAVEEDSEIKQLVDDYNKAQNITTTPVVNPTPKTFTPPVASNDKPYFPSQLCKVCHLKEYEDWEKTKHASAATTLINQQRTGPDCLPCHSEMYRKLGQFVPQEENRGGVECASCHMDALPHGMERSKVTEKTKVNPQICLNCHNKEHSPDYDEKTYMPMISHINMREAAASVQH